MKIVHVGLISTGTVIVLGMLMVIPSFILTGPSQTTLLSFSITDDSDVSQWCTDLSSVLKKHNLKAVVFVPGRIAEQYPECVSSFPDNVDIGSQTYDYVDLLYISDYTAQLEEIQKGKTAVDNAGKIDSRVFSAPFGHTDGNIYSLLSRADITADFSYNNHYNKYYDNKFIKFEIDSYNGKDNSVDFFRNLQITDKPIFINFDNSTPVSQIDNFLSSLKSKHNNFVSASELTGFDLTIRKSEKT